ncbi:MAG TPA: hypothetical protein VK507_04350, partial [Iamia sp.]|nr:hypothetical protein [Iamia sp.]
MTDALPPSPSIETVKGASLTGRHVFLTPIQTADLTSLYNLELSSDVGFRYRFRSATPSPEGHARSLWDSILATFMVRGRETGGNVGIVSA